MMVFAWTSRFCIFCKEKRWVPKKESIAHDFCLNQQILHFLKEKHMFSSSRYFYCKWIMVFGWTSRFCIFSRKNIISFQVFLLQLNDGFCVSQQILLFTRNDDAFLQGIRLRLIELHFIQRNMILKNWYQGKNSRC